MNSQQMVAGKRGHSGYGVAFLLVPFMLSSCIVDGGWDRCIVEAGQRVQLTEKTQDSTDLMREQCEAAVVEQLTGTYDVVLKDTLCESDDVATSITRDVELADERSCTAEIELLGDPEPGGVKAGPAPMNVECDGMPRCSYEFHSTYERLSPDEFGDTGTSR